MLNLLILGCLLPDQPRCLLVCNLQLLLLVIKLNLLLFEGCGRRLLLFCKLSKLSLVVLIGPSKSLRSGISLLLESLVLLPRCLRLTCSCIEPLLEGLLH